METETLLTIIRVLDSAIEACRAIGVATLAAFVIVGSVIVARLLTGEPVAARASHDADRRSDPASHGPTRAPRRRRLPHLPVFTHRAPAAELTRR